MVTVVCGFPGAGKTTYVKERMDKGDIMLDLDMLYHALTNRAEHERKDNNIANYINDLIKATIYKRDEYEFNNVWLIRCMPDDAEMELLKGSKFIWLNTIATECRRRLNKDNRLPVGFMSICERTLRRYDLYSDLFIEVSTK